MGHDSYGHAAPCSTPLLRQRRGVDQSEFMIRLAIVAGIRLYREGLAQVLGRSPHFEITATAARPEEVLPSLAELRPDVVLLDMAMPDSLPAVQAIVEAVPGLRIVALAVADEDDQVLACAEAGVAGYVPRAASLEDLVAVIQSVTRGETICSPRVAASLLRRVAMLAAGRAGLPLAVLTGREREILRLIDRGLSNKEIARDLGIEVATVKNHVHNILEKLKVHRRGEAAARMRGAGSLRLASS